MKDIPIFTTEHGVASLILQEIPMQGCAYVRIQTTWEPEKMLEDCIGFCRMAGAREIYASGHESLEAYPFHTALWEMCCFRNSLAETDAVLWPMQKDTAEAFRAIYNQKICGIPNAAGLSKTEAARIADNGGGYFIHRNKELLGIGIVEDSEIRFVASVRPGSGADIVCALACSIHQDKITLQVASENRRAIALYERLGFLKTREISRWYCVFRELKG